MNFQIISRQWLQCLEQHLDFFLLEVFYYSPPSSLLRTLGILSSFLLWGRNYLKNFLYYEWSLIYWYFVCFLSLEGCSWLRKIKRKLTEFLKRSYRNSRFSWYRTILFWAGFVWVGSCTGWVEWELNQQSRVWGALVWGSSGAGSWELKGLLILFRDFLQIVSGDTVQGYYQTLSYIYTFGVWCLVICYELICDQTLSLLLSLRELESWGVHWFYLGFSYGFYQVILYRVITKLFHIFIIEFADY